MSYGNHCVNTESDKGFCKITTACLYYKLCYWRVGLSVAIGKKHWPRKEVESKKLASVMKVYFQTSFKALGSIFKEEKKKKKKIESSA